MPIVARAHLRESGAIIVAKYARVSTLDQLDGFGLEAQDEISGGWLDRHPDVTVYDDYVDEAVAGTLESRPEMDRLVHDAHQRHFNRILVPNVDRIGRTARAAYQWACNMADLGIYFISVAEGIDTSTDVGWSRFVQYVTFSEMEWRRIKERTFAGRELKISYGGWPGGPAPYGYTLAQDTSWVGKRRKKFSVLVTDEHESMVLSVAVGLVVDQGMNYTEACDELNERKLSTRSGVPWTVGNLRNRLWSETIHDGHVVYRKTNRGNGKNTTLRCEDGTPVHGDPVRIGVPPIFSEERSRLLMETLKKIGFQNGRSKDQIYPLSGRIDGHCGEVYTGAGRSGDARAYRCKGMTDKEGSCGEPHFNADGIEGVVWAELTRFMKDEGRLRTMATEWVGVLPGEKEKYQQRATEFATRVAVQEDLIHRKVPEYLRAGVDPVVLKASVKEMQQELEEFRKQKGFAEQWLEAFTEYERQAHNLVAVANNARECLDNMTLEERGEIFGMFDIRVAPGAMENTAKPGVKCAVSQWHWETGTLVPPDPTDEEWESVLAVLRTFFQGRAKRHFTTECDIRAQFRGMLHRLRRGLAWNDMPLTWGPIDAMRTRQLKWWQKGAWPEVMQALGAERRGVEVYRRPTLPPLTVTGRLRAGLLAEVRSEVPKDKGENAIDDRDAVKADRRGYLFECSAGQIGFETAVNLIGDGTCVPPRPGEVRGSGHSGPRTA
ncbi:recombinase family protein [Streptomyces sp. NPDC017520]|uniref:recombinase family protein n=1 Tax=Streptomyces sp. NPDC017520 TaxID=3364998 RepID=UPI003798D063